MTNGPLGFTRGCSSGGAPGGVGRGAPLGGGPGGSSLSSISSGSFGLPLGSHGSISPFTSTSHITLSHVQLTSTSCPLAPIICSPGA